ncbi:hypothetical protein SSBR45G_47490 [Bradyrhizobium sp. SSBR45G]|nr:hypothetical protein SSBR45G_47490 [Bradyrhizobium sp. SSBR45G]GLH87216.1 hypothetical protein SSBR45R_46760 [Bradyrhizobium sp. SSBR45R]
MHAACSSALPREPCAKALVETVSDNRERAKRILRIVFLHFDSRGDLPGSPMLPGKTPVWFGKDRKPPSAGGTLPNAAKFAPYVSEQIALGITALA